MNLLQTDQVCTKPACCALSLLLLAGVVGIACAQPSSTTLTIGDAVECLAISPDGKTLAVGVRGFGNAPDVVGRIQFWDLTSNEPAATISARRGDLHSGHQGSASSLAFSPDGATLVSGGWDGSIRIWDLAAGRAKPVSWGGEMGSRSVSENGRPYGAVLGGAEEMALSPDGTKLAAYAGERVGVWDSQNPKRVAGYPQFPLLWNQTSSTVGDLAFSPDGRFLAIGIGDPYRCGVHIVEAASGRRLRTFERDQPTYAVAFSPDGNTLAWTGTGKAITLWDLTKGDQASPFSSAGVSKTLQPPSSKVFDLAFSPDGKTLAAGGEKGRLTLWNVDDGTLKAALEGHTAEVRFVAFSPNGAILASGSGDHTIRLWRLATEDARPADATEHHLIQGAWRVVSIVRDGKPAAPTTVTTYAFDDTSVTIQTADNSPVLASYKINPTFRPGRLDIVHETQGKSQVSEMVYSLQGDALTLCYAKQGQPRPTSLDSAPSDQRTVLVLKRAPEAASAATGGERQAKNTDDSPPPRKPSPEVDETAFQSL
ncbi:MAG: TIGR03067 domain-containing protein, partial [Planctomycetes bacterium]|nr:TIGR03067 domain-containing protein [Planctomycetota bacterium]